MSRLPVRVFLLLLLLFGSFRIAGAQTAGSEKRAPHPDGPGARLDRLRREERGPAPPSPAESAARRVEIASQYAARGDSARAVEILREAAERDPTSGETYARLTLLHLQEGDFEFARATLDEAAERSDLHLGPAALWNEAADRFAAAHRVEDAIAVWELVESHGAADPAASARLARARRETAASPGQRLRQSDRFTIYADAAIPEDELGRVESHLDEEYARQHALFGGAPLPVPQIVVLYSGRRFFSLVSVPDWVSGVFDGKIRVSLEAGRGFTPEVASVLSHELTHAWIRFLSNDRAPGWLHEGLAQWVEGRRMPRRDLKAMFASRPALPLGDLEANLAKRTDIAIARANYIEALGLVEYVAAAKGEGALVCVVRDLGEGLTLGEAILRETGSTPGELVGKWRAWIEGK